MSDVTIPDGAIIFSSSAFTKTWRIQNTGSCTWTKEYKLIFVNGPDLASPKAISLPVPVAPGQTIDISINLIAPSETGTYQGDWMLEAPGGKRFGVGLAADKPIWVKIRVVEAPTPTPTVTATNSPLPTSTETLVPPTETQAAFTETPVLPTQVPGGENLVYDFAGSACTAQWIGAGGILPCPGSLTDEAGSIQVIGAAQLEDGSTASLPSLLLMPGAAPESPVQGIYPEYHIQAGDHFRTSVSCEKDSESCSVLFKLAYLDESGAEQQLWSFGEFQDGQYFSLDLDLTPLEGRTVRFILGVAPLGSSTGDHALWVNPRIVRLPVPILTPASTATLEPATPSSSPSSTPSSTPLPPTFTPTPVGPAPDQGPAGVIRQLFEQFIEFINSLFGN